MEHVMLVKSCQKILMHIRKSEVCARANANANQSMPDGTAQGDK